MNTRQAADPQPPARTPTTATPVRGKGVGAVMPVYRLQVPAAGDMNPRIESAFERALEAPATRQSHLFHGRYENIYPERREMPEIDPLIDIVERSACEVLGRTRPFRTGFWFNRMAPGDVTTLHQHDDDDELLSAVYYVTAPPRSGRLVFRAPDATMFVDPGPGLLLLFPPDLPHEVERHEGQGVRLSIAFNLGPGNNSV